jgi:hypothetical protein
MSTRPNAGRPGDNPSRLPSRTTKKMIENDQAGPKPSECRADDSVYRATSWPSALVGR